ncbi:MAG: rhomboid family intramembrane serine protease [Candidatus Hadarchaeum sp.]|uniref:rhomboid family intramembrane serine protease n=1 Tax=Candidatus Hadarchaeum sp. TaxID=2883567 RepID=UPI003D13958A
MAVCDKCGKEVALPFRCSYCGGDYCAEHRLPENHGCQGKEIVTLKEAPQPIEAEKAPEPQPYQFRYDFYTLKPPEKRRRGFPRPAASLILLVLIVSVFIVQLAAQFLLGSAYYRPGDHGSFLYFLATSGATVFARPWTLVTSIFVHGGFLHLFFNCLVLLSFGPILETRIGSKRFLFLFFVSGILAALGQLFFTAPEAMLLGASGAILGVLGTLTVLAPRLPVLLFFIIPLRLWMATLGLGILSVLLVVFEVGGSIANVAHLVGLVVGVIYGYQLKREERRTQEMFFRRFLGQILAS